MKATPLCTCNSALGAEHEIGCPARDSGNCPHCFVAEGKPHRNGCPSVSKAAVTADIVTADIVTAITAARGSVYGPFLHNAIVAQGIKDTMRNIPGSALRWEGLPLDVRQVLDEIATKVARIVTGDPEYLDNWDDIQGYAKIVADRIRRSKGETK